MKNLIALPSTICLALFVASTSASPAYSKHRHHHHPQRTHQASSFSYRHHHRGVRYAHGTSNTGGRPRAWCGWQLRQWLHVADPAFNLAREWLHWGRPTEGAKAGTVVVYPHHVAQIVGECRDGGCLMRSGNDGHQVRTRWRKLAGNIGMREE